MNSLKFFVIADEHTIKAFSLAGIRGEVAHTPGKVKELLVLADKGRSGAYPRQGPGIVSPVLGRP